MKRVATFFVSNQTEKCVTGLFSGKIYTYHSMGVFRFKRFSIDDSRCGMKIGTDGVLLGAWARVDGSCGHVIDVGTGSGLVALMMAQRYPGVRVTGVDVDPDACLDACDNAKASPGPHA